MTPALAESTIALYDIDAVRLDESAAMLEAINRNNGSKARIEKYLGVENRKDALRGANYVVCLLYTSTCLLVTHDIDEAIYLSDRILVFGGSPAQIRSVVPVQDRERTRDWLYAQSDLRRRLHNLIRGTEEAR